MKYTAHSLEEMQKIAADFVMQLQQNTEMATVVGLSGDLGAGKTSFSQGVAKALGIEENVVSPTFVIEKIYELKNSSDIVLRTSYFDHLIHIDAYRLERSDELLHLGWKEITSNPHNLILIEWPERVADIMPLHTPIQFTHLSEGVREVEIS